MDDKSTILKNYKYMSAVIVDVDLVLPLNRLPIYGFGKRSQLKPLTN